MSEEKLKPCPSCGSDSAMIDHSQRSGHRIFGGIKCYVECETCELRGPWIYDSDAKPIEWWNTLPRREEFHAELMELKRSYSKGYVDLESVRWDIDHIAMKYAPKEDNDE